jgi:hypothetical protein
VETVFELDDTLSTAADPFSTAYLLIFHRFLTLCPPFPTLFPPLSDPLSTALQDLILISGDLSKIEPGFALLTTSIECWNKAKVPGRPSKNGSFY